MATIQYSIQKILNLAGITINGSRPWDIRVNSDNFYRRVLEGSLGLGESYLDGDWDVVSSLDSFFYRVISKDLAQKVRGDSKVLMFYLKNLLFNQQLRSRSAKVGQVHYDIGNELYKLMLDPRLVYSCAYYQSGAHNLAEAQEAKLDLICRKLKLVPGQSLLDIGGGWGGLAKYAAETYGVSVDVLTISKEQAEFGQQLCAGLPIRFYLEDYRDYQRKSGGRQYDNLVSVGMFEHVGYKNYGQYMKVANRFLKDNGLFLLHTIGGNTSVVSGDPWLEKYIFPNSMLPSLKQITGAMEGVFSLQDLHSFGGDYDRTLMAWYNNFSDAWPELKSHYGERFFRMWKYYLLSCAGAFRAEKIRLWQLVLAKGELSKSYISVR